jgi:hypothetical protein
VTTSTAEPIDTQVPEQVGKFPTCDPPTVTRWEYLAVPVVAAGFEDAAGIDGYHGILNDHGRDGWELVGVTGYPGKSVEGWVTVFCFKRPVAGATPVE